MDGTDGGTLARVAVRVRKVELSLWPLGGLGLAAPADLPASQAGSVRRATGQHDRARARERGGRAQEQRSGARTGPQPGRLRHPDPQPGGSAGPSPASARDGRTAPRQPPSSGLGGRRDRRAPALPDRRPGLYDSDGFRAWWAQRGIEAVIPARRGRTHPQSHDPEKYKARKAVERGLGGLKQGRRVATRYDKHAQRCLGFLYLAAAWIWLQS